MTDTQSRVLAVINSVLGLRTAPPTLDDTLEALAIGHIDLICIACSLEEEFGFEVGDDEMYAWSSVADVLASVEKRRWEAA